MEQGEEAVVTEKALDEREEIQLLCWRLETLERAGYDYAEACLLAAAEYVNIHRALELLGMGCSPETAARILL